MGRKSKRNHIPAEATGNRPNLAGIHYKAGIYARLSVKKEEKMESINVQVKIAKKFVEDWNKNHADKIEVIDCYKDLGKTGTSFERDEFKRLMQDVRLGDVDCVIVKDLSRFGRNYLEAGNYIEKIFPFLGVRFIAVADGYDTAADDNDTDQMATEIKNLVNDMYAKDFSVKARLSLAQRRQEGSYVGGPPPYGYKAVWEGKLRRLVPDENTAGMIRHIYCKFIETESYKAVTDDLNKSRVNPPSIYRKSGEVYCPSGIPYKGWAQGYMEILLKNETYIGRLVQGKTSISSGENFQSEYSLDENIQGDNSLSKYSQGEFSPGEFSPWDFSPRDFSLGKEMRRAEEETWEVKEQAHEPLVEKEIFEQAREVRQKIRRKQESHKHPTKGYPIETNVFENTLFCGVCGRKMTRHSHVRSYADGSKRRAEEYFCINGANTKTDRCPSPNYYVKNHLADLLLALLELEFAVVLKKQREYEVRGKDILEEKKKELELALRRLQGERDRIDKWNSSAYIAYRMGKLSQEELTKRRQQREAGLQELLDREAKLREAIQKLEKSEKAFLSAVRALVKPKDGRMFTKEFVAALIDKIYVYPGKRMEVVFAFENVFQKAEAAK